MLEKTPIFEPEKAISSHEEEIQSLKEQIQKRERELDERKEEVGRPNLAKSYERTFSIMEKLLEEKRSDKDIEDDGLRGGFMTQLRRRLVS